MKSSACVVVLVAACLAGCSDTSGPKAIYLVQGQGVLSGTDLNAHPEVVVVNTFEELWQRTDKPVALWIDMNAVGLVDIARLRSGPRKWYPIAVVGCHDPLYAFRETLPAFGTISGPAVDWAKRSVSPGFSVGILLEDRGNRTKGGSSWWKGYPGPPAVKVILEVTNALLEGRRDELISAPPDPGPRP